MALGRSASALAALAATALGNIGAAHSVERQDHRFVEPELKAFCLTLQSNPDMVLESQDMRRVRIAAHITDIGHEIEKIGREFKAGTHPSTVSDGLASMRDEVERSLRVLELFEQNSELQNEMEESCRGG